MTAGAAPGKDALRATMLSARKEMRGDVTPSLRALLARWPAAAVAAYWPVRDEADPRPALIDWGGPLLLPAVTGTDLPLQFRVWDKDGASLVPGRFGIPVPPPGAAQHRPDIVLVPLVAVDAGGNRLGYGGGFYDRTLQQLRLGGPVVAIGVAYDAQIVPQVPVGSTDQLLDWLVCEAGSRQCRPTS